MADDVWYRMYGGHSSCCGIHVLTAVRNPRVDNDNGIHLSFYGYWPEDPYSSGWRTSELDARKWDEAIESMPELPNNPGWECRFNTSKTKAGMQLLRFVAPDADVPEDFTMLAENSHGKLIGKVAGWLDQS